MKRILIITLIIASFYSCSTSTENKQEESKQNAITEYCDCLNNSINDSILTLDSLVTLDSTCYKAMMKKYKSKIDSSFVSSFDTIQKIIQLKDAVKTKVSVNINNVLKNNTWKTNLYVDQSTNSFASRIFKFEGKMFSQNIVIVYSDSYSYSGTYSIEREDNEFYILLKYDDGEEGTLKLVKKGGKIMLENSNYYFFPELKK